jgi:signal transduction histidine kinase
MFNKEGIPFFIITIPFLCVIFISIFSTSYYLKLTQEDFEKSKKEIIVNFEKRVALNIIEQKSIELKIQQEKFKKFMIVMTSILVVFLALFSYLMITKVNQKEAKLQYLNKNLESKVQAGIQEAKQKDKKILEQAKLARIGSMISMIAHQWRQPLSQLSAILMELQTATRFKKVDEEHIYKAVEKSDEMIEFMSNTIDDFRNFYKPDKTKEEFLLSDSCKKAINIIEATLYNLNIELNLNIVNDKKIYGYPTEFSQVILNIISNAKDILVEKKISKPRIILTIDTKGVLGIIEIEDNAGGISCENMELIFDPYFSTKDSSKGTGLGLYVSKLIVERNMGGELSVYNSEKGAVFKIVIAG